MSKAARDPRHASVQSSRTAAVGCQTLAARTATRVVLLVEWMGESAAGEGVARMLCLCNIFIFMNIKDFYLFLLYFCLTLLLLLSIVRGMKRR